MAAVARNKNTISVVLIGCGNLAWHVAKQFSKHKQLAITVVNHKPNTALDDFRLNLKAKVLIGLENIPTTANFYILCVSDAAIAGVVEAIKPANPKAVLLHTSGSTDMNVFHQHICGYGVMYPLQSFSKAIEINWATTPVLLEGKDAASVKQIKSLATFLTSNVHNASSEKRLHLHLAAVLVNNFTNALFAAADMHLTDKGYKNDFKLFESIIQTGIDKLKVVSPRAAQTGPAKRNDKKTMRKHLVLLKEEKELKKVYKDMSKLIRSQQDGRT